MENIGTVDAWNEKNYVPETWWISKKYCQNLKVLHQQLNRRLAKNKEYYVSFVLDNAKAETLVENVVIASGSKMVLNVSLGLKLVLYCWGWNGDVRLVRVENRVVPSGIVSWWKWKYATGETS